MTSSAANPAKADDEADAGAYPLDRSTAVDRRDGPEHVDGSDEPDVQQRRGARAFGQPLWFVVAEAVLILAVPVLAFLGARELLGSTSGTFLSTPAEGEPGWSAVVEPSPVLALAEVLDGQVTGYAIVTRPGDGADGGAVLLVSPETVLADGRRLSQMESDAAFDALSREIRLQFTETRSVDDWSEVLGSTVLTIDNPDPLAASPVSPAVGVGEVAIEGNRSAFYLGTHRDDADPRSLLFRRQLWWEALLETGPAGSAELAPILDSVGAGIWRVEPLTVEDHPEGLSLQLDRVEELVNEVVPLPAGAVPGDRTIIRIVDRTGEIDTRALAVAVGGLGYEVSAIANAAVFDQGPTQMIVPVTVDPAAVRDLANDLGAATVTPDPIEDSGEEIVVLLAGPDLVLD